jgi:hypothetical protein
MWYQSCDGLAFLSLASGKTKSVKKGTQGEQQMLDSEASQKIG